MGRAKKKRSKEIIQKMEQRKIKSDNLDATI